jgi:hypothetical protein
LASSATSCESGSTASENAVPTDSTICLGRAAHRVFPPYVGAEIVRIACTMPRQLGRAICLWTCREIAAQLVADGVVPAISAQTVQRVLQSHKLKPWRVHHWLNPKKPRDEAFVARTKEICDLYTRQLRDDEVVLCVDEKTSIQPRPRVAPTRPACPGRPVEVEHEYRRDGALHLFAALNTRSGEVVGRCYRRKRQIEFIDFLESLETTIPALIKTIHIVCDNVSVHHGKAVQAWLKKHRRFVFHFLPVHCSWMNQIEQWFSILTRQCLRIPHFDDKADLEARLGQFIDEWNIDGHPFAWQEKSFEKVLAKAEREIRARDEEAKRIGVPATIGVSGT